MTYLYAFLAWLAIVIYLLAWFRKMRQPYSEWELTQDRIIAARRNEKQRLEQELAENAAVMISGLMEREG